MIKKNIALALLLTLSIGMLQNNFTPKTFATQAEQQSQASNDESEDEVQPSIWDSYIKPLVTSQIENFKNNSDSYVVGRGIETVKQNVKEEGGGVFGFLRGLTNSISRGGVNTRTKTFDVGTKEELVRNRNVKNYNSYTLAINKLSVRNKQIERELLPDLKNKKTNALGILNEKARNREIKNIDKKIKSLDNEIAKNGIEIKKQVEKQSNYANLIGLKV
jgi:hypothetical protein